MAVCANAPRKGLDERRGWGCEQDWRSAGTGSCPLHEDLDFKETLEVKSCHCGNNSVQGRTSVEWKLLRRLCVSIYFLIFIDIRDKHHFVVPLIYAFIS